MTTYAFCVGSTNPVKKNAVKQALSEKMPEAEVEGFEVPSGVNAQPMTDEETRLGAENRARAAVERGKLQFADQTTEVFGIGLEGGIFQDSAGELWSTVWAAVVSPEGDLYVANGSRIRIPETIAQPMLKGEEMGPLVERLTGLGDVRQKQGMFGVITQNFVTRTEEYSSIVKMALGLWYGRDWDKMLPL
jgi:inosine/xanthosine triphosphatase